MNKEHEKPFSPRESKEKFRERIAFSIMRAMTYFVLFCVGYLFWDIASKGSRKIFEGKGIINWEFFSEEPQTLHIITDENNRELKLSAKRYFALKEQMVLEKWNRLQAELGYRNRIHELDVSLEKLLVDSNKTNLPTNLRIFVDSEKEKSAKIFDFWISLLNNPDLTAREYDLKVEEVPSMVGSFAKGHFSQDSHRLKLLENEIIRFRAVHFRAIADPTAESLAIVKQAYSLFLESRLPSYSKELAEKARILSKEKKSFLSDPSPFYFEKLSTSLRSYEDTRETLFGKKEGKGDWSQTIQALTPFENASSAVLPSKDYDWGSGGGIFPAIAGTLLLVAGSMTIAFVLGVFCAIFLSEYGKPGRFLSLVRLAVLNLSGVPSIIFGLFGFGLFVIFLDWNKSLLAGWFTLGFMVLPIVITASEESLRSIPKGFRESSLALGASKWTMIRTSVLPFAMPGILTSSILGVARVAGETAPIMFTAAYLKRSELPWVNLDSTSDFFFQGVMALPYHIYLMIKIEENEYSQDMQYGTALVFLTLVIGITLTSIVLRNKLRNMYRW